MTLPLSYSHGSTIAVLHRKGERHPYPERAFSIFVKVWPIDLWREIRERNVAAAIVAGAVALGLCWIIAATMH